MKLFIFKCNNQTQDECISKNLFGGRGPWVSYVKAGSLCLLYNFQREIIYGIWTASKENGTLEETAFDGKFPNQVRVLPDSVDGIRSAPKSKVEELSGVKFSASKPFEIDLSNEAIHRLFNRQDEQVAKVAQTIPESEEDFRRQYPRDYHCDDGHDVRSKGETLIDNWLFNNNICHGYEVLMRIQETMYPDFTVYKEDGRQVYIEYWGLEGDPSYNARKKRKQEIYSKHKLDLIEITDSDIKNLDFVMRKKLREKKVIK